MTRSDELKALLERVKAATGPDRELDCDIARWSGWMGHAAGLPNAAFIGPDVVMGPCGLPPPSLTSSIDADVALVERGLPGWSYTIGAGNRDQDCGPWSEMFSNRFFEDNGSFAHEFAEEHGATLPLSILAALLSALIAQEEQKP